MQDSPIIYIRNMYGLIAPTLRASYFVAYSAFQPQALTNSLQLRPSSSSSLAGFVQQTTFLSNSTAI